jgi:N-glycosylase/DNA lyase
MGKEELMEDYAEYGQEIKSKLEEFSNLNKEDYKQELFFCLLTPQSKAEKCWQAVLELKNCRIEKENVEVCLKTKTRFYRNKTRYIIEANNKWEEIEKIVGSGKTPAEMRKSLIKEVKRLGMKEASHFLRNINKSKNELAILDRHIIKKLVELEIIQEIPTLNEKNYLIIEDKMKQFSRDVEIPLDELDLLFWKIESGRIFK